jgi:hypothetical protein
MFDYFEFWLIVVALLMVYLGVSVERRLRAEDARFEEERRQARARYVSGPPTDISAIAPQIRQLRQDNFAAVHSRPHYAFYRRGLIAAVLKVVTSRSYFHRERLEHDIQKHDG